MNWLDTQTRELLQKARDEKLAPAKTAEFALVLLRKGQEHRRLIDAVMQINESIESDARVLASRRTPVVVNPDLTEEEALWGQFELICCDAVSIFLRSEVVEQNDSSYLWPLYKKVLDSSEFRPATVSITQIPHTESGEKFVEQFLGDAPARPVFPVTVTIPFKKARIMEHWATRVGAQLKLDKNVNGEQSQNH